MRAVCVALSFLVVSCQCVVAPAVDGGGSHDAGFADAGPTDGGGEPDGGIDAGAFDGGSTDAGVLDGGLLDAGVRDAGLVPCSTWQCVQAGWPLADAGALSEAVLEEFTLDAGTCDLSYKGYWGAVLRPDGHVIAIPSDADCVLEIDPSLTPVGLRFWPLPNRTTTRKKWVGGVLWPNGSVIAAPYRGLGEDAGCRFLEIKPDGGLADFGPDLCSNGVAPSLVGGALDEAGTAWFGSANPDGGLHLLADGGVEAMGVDHAGLWGMGRNRDGQLVAPAADAMGTFVVIEGTARASTVTTSIGLEGVTLLRDGLTFVTVAATGTQAFTFNATDGFLPDQLSSRGLLPTTAAGPRVLGADGFVYAFPDEDNVLLRFQGGARVGVQVVESRVDAGTLPRRNKYSGGIATPYGLIAVPFGGRTIARLRTPGGETRSLPVLLSPYFNHL